MGFKTVPVDIEWVIRKYEKQGQEPYYTVHSGPHTGFGVDEKPKDDPKNGTTFLIGRQYIEVEIWEDE